MTSCCQALFRVLARPSLRGRARVPPLGTSTTVKDPKGSPGSATIFLDLRAIGVSQTIPYTIHTPYIHHTIHYTIHHTYTIPTPCHTPYISNTYTIHTPYIHHTIHRTTHTPYIHHTYTIPYTIHTPHIHHTAHNTYTISKPYACSVF